MRNGGLFFSRHNLLYPWERRHPFTLDLSPKSPAMQGLDPIRSSSCKEAEKLLHLIHCLFRRFVGLDRAFPKNLFHLFVA